MALNFIFFGRFEREKGFDLLCEAAQQWKKEEQPFCLFLFGQGSVEPFFTQDCRAFSDEEVLNVHAEEGEVFYFGHRPSQLIRAFMEKHVDYALMPSRFLETFGFSALEALATGVPVVGPRKGGLRAFDPLDVSLKDVPTLSKPSANLRATLKEKAAEFEPQLWLQKLQKLLPEGAKKILLVSDFLEPIGGTEQHVHAVAALLKGAGYTVCCFGKGKAPWPRALGLFYALWNPVFAGRLHRQLQDFQPDVVWCHSTLRFLGPSALREMNRSSAFKMLTVHDLGLFVPYPSRLEEESDLLSPKWRSPLALLKRFGLIRPTLHCLKKFDLILVPSEFMRGLLPGCAVRVLAHFLK